MFTDFVTFDTAPIPEPASLNIPEWYKKMQSYTDGKKVPLDSGKANSTVKKCMPVFDSITCGYIIVSPCDVYVEQRNGEPYFKWSGYNTIEFHPISQTYGHPTTKDGLGSPKWMSPWAIKTPRGYSVLVMQPAHRDLPFTILPGIVDTDFYTAPVNFPFKLNDPNWEGMIPAGTPIAQLIPFKRENWKMEIGDDKERKKVETLLRKLDIYFFDRYKKLWWQKKQYK